jgi:predicted ABC-type ATPase
LNSDQIAAQLLDEGHPHAGLEVAAGRVILGQLHEIVAERTPFCIETNLAGRGLIHRIDDWRAHGYAVRLVFTSLDSPELALSRVASRVKIGGHDVPEPVVRRRWAAGLRSLFDLYLPNVDHWRIFDNSEWSLRGVAEDGGGGSIPRVLDDELWLRILNLATLAGALSTRQGGEFFDAITPINDDGDSKA